MARFDGIPLEEDSEAAAPAAKPRFGGVPVDTPAARSAPKTAPLRRSEPATRKYDDAKPNPYLVQEGPGPTGKISPDLYEMGAIARRPVDMDTAKRQMAVDKEKAEAAAKKEKYQSRGGAILTEVMNTPARWRMELAGLDLAQAEARMGSNIRGLKSAKGDPEEKLAVLEARRDEITKELGETQDFRRAAELEAEYRSMSEEVGRLQEFIKDPEYRRGLEDSSRAGYFSAVKNANEAQTAVDAAQSDLVESNAEPTTLNKALVAGISSVGHISPALAASLVTKNPIPTMLFLLGSSKGGSYADMRGEGFGIDKSAVASSLSALAEAIPEILPLSVILQRGVGAISKIGGGTVAEAISETITGGLQTLVDQEILDKDFTWAEVKERLTDSAAAGAVMGLIMGAGATAYDSATRKRDPKDAAGTPGDPNAYPPLPSGVSPDEAAALTPATAPTPSGPGVEAGVDPDVAVALGAASKPPTAPVEDTPAETEAPPRTAADVARERLRALRNPTPEAAPEPAPEAPAEAPTPAAPPPTTPETAAPEPAAPEPAAPAAPETAPPEPPTVPEAPKTIELQREALRAGTKPVVLYPMGTVPPPEMGAGFKRVYVNGVGRFDYNPKKISAQEIRAIIKAGNLNELLELGPVDKPELAARLEAGETPAAVVERAPDGTEVKAAAGTTATVAAQEDALEATKASPKNTVRREDPQEVLRGRQEAAKVEANPVRTVEMSEEEKQALVRKYGFGPDTGPAPAAPPVVSSPGVASQPAPAPAKATTQATAAKAPKAEAAKAVSAERSAKPAKVTVTPEGKRVVDVTSTEARRATDKFNEEISKRAQKAEETETDEDNFAVKRGDSVEDRRADANRGAYKSAAEEAVARQSEKDKKGTAVREARIKQAEAAAKVAKDMLPRSAAEAGSLSDIPALADRLRKTLNAATAAGVDLKAKVSDLTTNANLWLKQVQAMSAKLDRLSKVRAKSDREQIMGEVLLFLDSEKRFADEGDATDIRQVRSDEGEAAQRGAPVDKGTLENTPNTWEQYAGDDQLSPEDALIAKEEADRSAEEDSAAVTKEEDRGTEADRPATPLKGDEVLAGKDRTGAFKVEARKTRKVTPPGKTPPKRMASEPVAASTKIAAPPVPPPADPRGEVKEGVRAVLKARIRQFLRGWERSVPQSVADDLNARHAAMDKHFATLKQTQKGLPEHPEALFAKHAYSVRELLAGVKEAADFSGKAPAGQRVLFKFFGKEAQFQTRVSEILRDMLLNLVGDVRVYVLTDADYLALNPGTGGLYTVGPGRDYITLPESIANDPTALQHIAQHEVFHAALFYSIERLPTLRGKIRKLMDISLDAALNKGYSGSFYFHGNEHEFMSEVLSNPELQRFLAEQPLSKADAEAVAPVGIVAASIKNVLDAVKSLASSIFKVPTILSDLGLPTDTKTVFDASMDIAAVLFSRTASSRAMNLSKRGVRPSSQKAGPRVLAVRSTSGRPSRFEEVLRKHGLSRAQAAEVAEVIRTEFDGKATDEELKALAEAIKDELPKDVNKSKAKVGSYFDGTVGGIRRQAEQAAAEAKAQLEQSFTPNKNPGRPRWLSVATNYQIGEIADRYFGKMSNPVRVIAAWVERRRVLKARYLKELSPVITKLAEAEKAHSREQWAEFLSLAQDSTLANVHPDIALEDNKHLGKDALDGMWGKARHEGLARRFEALPPELQQLYKETQQTLTDTQNRMALAVISNILEAAGQKSAAMAQRFHEGRATDSDYRAVGEQLAAHIERADQLRKIEGPYFNLVRRGGFLVRGRYKVTPPVLANAPSGFRVLAPNQFEFRDRKEAITFVGNQKLRPTVQKIWVDPTGKQWVTDPDGKEVKIDKTDTGAEARYVVTVQDEYLEFLDTRKAAHKARKAMIASKDFRDGTIPDVEAKRYERNAPNADMLSDQMRAVMEAIGKNERTSKLSPAQRGEMAGVLNEISLRFLGSTRIQSARLPRRGVAGADLDLVRNTFDYVDSASGYLAKLDTAPTLQNALVDMERRVKDLSAKGTGAGEGARDIANVIEQRVYAREVGEDDGSLNNGVNRLTALSFLYNLASPAYSIINSTQVGMMTLPVLSGDFNPASASFHLTKAYRDAGAVGILGGGLADTARAARGKMVTADRFVDDIKRKLNPNERRMIDELADEGLIDADGGLEIARVIDRQKDGVWGKVDSGIYYLDNIARALPSAVESVNRSVSAIAAYRLSMRKTNDHAASVQYAKDVVNDTQALMSNSNAAPIFSHPVGRIALQFKKFGQMTYYLMGKNIGRIIRPMAKGERIKGIKTMAYILATHQIMAGFVGLPWEPLRLALIVFNALGVTDYEWEDFEDDIEEAMASLLGSEKAGEMASFGVTRGIPGGWAPDLNARIGLDSLLAFGEPRGSGESDIKAYILDMVAGPTGRLAGNIGKGAADLINGEFSKLPSLLIPFKALADVGRAYRGTERGEMNTPDAVLRMIGFASARQSNISREIGGNIRENIKGRNNLTEARNAYLNARTPGELAKATSKVRAYNDALEKGDRNRLNLKNLEVIRKERMSVYAD